MVRCKLAVALPSDTCPVGLAGGVFAVPKDEPRDRFICDRKPQNSQESAVNRLRRLILERPQALGVHIIDTRNCFHLYQVDSSRWHTQVIGPRTPASWLHHLDDDSHDDVNDGGVETWWEPDPWRSAGDDELNDGCGHIAIVGVMMGDTNAVTVDMAHRRQVINAGVLRN